MMFCMISVQISFSAHSMINLFIVHFQFRFGPRESKKAMMYSDVGRLNCNVSYTTFASPGRGQVFEIFPCITWQPISLANSCVMFLGVRS